MFDSVLQNKMLVLVTKQNTEERLGAVHCTVAISQTDYGYLLSTSTRNSLGKRVDVVYPVFIKDFEKNKENYFWKQWERPVK